MTIIKNIDSLGNITFTNTEERGITMEDIEKLIANDNNSNIQVVYGFEPDGTKRIILSLKER